MVRRAGIEHTNGTDDGGTAEVLGRHHLGVELGVPLQLHPVGQVVKGASGSHCDLLQDKEIVMAEGRVGVMWERKARRGREKKLSEGREGKCWPPILQTISAICSRPRG